MSYRIAVYDGQMGYRSIEFDPSEPGEEVQPEAYFATVTVMYVLREVMKHPEDYHVSLSNTELQEFYEELNEGFGALTDYLEATTDIEDLEFRQSGDFRFIGSRHAQVVIETLLTR